MPMTSKKWLHGSQELGSCQAKRGYIEVKNYAYDKQEVVTWRSRTMPCQARSGYKEV